MENNKAYELADSLEQFMYERGEYDYGGSDRVRWLEEVPETYELAEDYGILQDARETVTNNIETALTNGEIEPVINYLEDQIAEMDEEDELISKAEGLIRELQDYQRETAIAYTADDLNKADIKDIDALFERSKDNFELMSFYDYAESGYEVFDDADYDISVSASVPTDEYGDSDYEASDRDIEEITAEIKSDIDHLLANYEPMVAVDTMGNAAPVNLFKDENDNLVKGEEIDAKIEKILSDYDGTEIEVYGRLIDNDWYSPPYYEEGTGTISVEMDDFEAFYYARDDIREQMKDIQIERDIDNAYDIIESGNYAIKRDAIGLYDVIDTIDSEIIATGLENIDDVLTVLDTHVNCSLLDYTAEELMNTDYKGEIPNTTYEWKEFASKPENAEFVKGHKAELEEMAFVSDLDRINHVPIAKVSEKFNPEEKEIKKFYKESKWTERGDVNPVDYGGMFVRQTNKGEYEAVLVAEGYDDKMFAGYRTFDVSDIADLKANEDIQQIANPVNRKYVSDKEYIFAAMQEMGMSDLQLTAFNENGSQAHYDITMEAYAVDKDTLAQGLADMNIDIGDYADKLVEKELSEALVTLLESRNYELDRTDDGDYTLYDKELGDYKRNENGEIAVYDTFESLVIDVGSTAITEITSELDEVFEQAYPKLDPPDNYVPFAEGHPDEDFVKDHATELTILKLDTHIHDVDSLDKAYEIQNDRQAQAQEKSKETPDKSTKKKFDKTDD